MPRQDPASGNFGDSFGYASGIRCIGCYAAAIA
jgi:hypothetical protein